MYNLGAASLRENHLFSYLLHKSEGQAINLPMAALLNASFFRVSIEYS